MAAILYSVLALAFTYPLVLHPAGRLLGDGDAWNFNWNMWFMRFSLLQFKNPFCSDYIHFPTGACSYLHSWTFTNTIPSVALQSFFSTVTTYNVLALLSFVLAGLGMFCLARVFGIGTAGAVIAGIAYSFSPYHFAHARGHLNLISYQWIPFFVASFLTGARKGWPFRNALTCSLWLTTVALTDWYYFIFCIFAVGIIVLSAAFESQRSFSAALMGSAKVVALSLAMMSPLLFKMLDLALEGVLQDRVTRWYSADLQGFLIPGPISSYSRWFARWNSTWTGGPAELGTFIPWSVLVLAVLGWRWMKKTDNRLLAIWIPVFFVLSLGPFLHWGGRLYYSVLLPFGWIEKLPGLGMMRAPVRFHILTYIGICLLYGFAVNRLAAAGRPLLKSTFFGSVVLLESLSIPVQTASKDISPFYERLRDSSDHGAVIDLHYNHRALYYQTVHQKKIMGLYGMLSRQPNYALDFLRNTPSVKELIEENLWKSAANGWPAEILRQKAPPNLVGDFTFVAFGYVTTSGKLRVITQRPHRLWIGDHPAGSEPSNQTELDISPGGERQFIRLVTSLNIDDMAAAAALPRIHWNNHELSAQSEAHCGGCLAGIEPAADLGDNHSQGLTCLFYSNATSAPANPESAVANLRKIGFRWIIVPFYGNDHFVRSSLKLKPFYQDRWLQAFLLDNR